MLRMTGVRVRLGHGGMSALSPFYPQLRTLVDAAGTAGSCHNRTYAVQQTELLFDHLVGAGENRIRHGQAEGLGGLEIDDELEPGRQLDRQLARLGTIEDAIDIGGRTPVAVGEVLAVADQS